MGQACSSGRKKGSAGSDGERTSTTSPKEVTPPEKKAQGSTSDLPNENAVKVKSNLLDLDTTQIPVTDVYDFGKKLGSGAFSIVHEGINKKSGDRVAIKVVKKAVLKGDDIITLKREVENLRKLDHPNILKLYDVFESQDEFFLIMELVEGKELFDKIIEKGNYSERDASICIRQIVGAIEYLHSQGIAHRDLKPENLLSSGEGENERVKVADFGLSKNFGEDRLKTSCGSPGYVAPEVLTCDSPYDKAVDMWSIGVILYILLCGYPPFFAEDDPSLFKKIMDVDYNFDGEEWDEISETAKELIKKLLTKDPAVRLTASQMKEDPWVKGETDVSKKQLQMEKLREYNQTRRKIE
eukprot:TRINITY_DN1659_c0_g1_i2.p1 TRINITY_DN1659_c0_g1~~TRINITY_DN1659_c0_g1_i2.p1  ORF type:complete len:354 (-),score=125.62 TRINITY_DN1659_c0_g1_i2:80-1141(-)